jgi:hypothetical protein
VTSFIPLRGCQQWNVSGGTGWNDQAGGVLLWFAWSRQSFWGGTDKQPRVGRPRRDRDWGAQTG